jgi:hypothetical protein
MEILCPNCQRKLTILEQYAGQQMKCPLCAGTFSAPALPPTLGVPATPSSPIPPAPPPVPPSPPSGAGAPVPDTFGAPLPNLDLPPVSPSPVPAEHAGRFSVWISPRICQFVPVVLLFLVFILTWFTWVAFAPGGVYVDSQNAWQAAFGSVSTDPDLKKNYSSLRTSEDKDDAGTDAMLNKGLPIKAGDPGFGVVAFFWLLALLANFMVAVAAVAVGYVHGMLPPSVQPYLRWRWAAVALVTLVCFLLLALQHSIGFNLERNNLAAIDRLARRLDEQSKTSPDPGASKAVAIVRGTLEQAVVRTFWYRCAYWFYFWAMVFAFITMLADLRSPRPAPRIDLLI